MAQDRQPKNSGKVFAVSAFAVASVLALPSAIEGIHDLADRYFPPQTYDGYAWYGEEYASVRPRTYDSYGWYGEDYTSTRIP